MADANAPYLPALEPCLHGETLLLSWQDAYIALRQHLARERRQRLVRLQTPLARQSTADEEPVNPQLLAFLSHNAAISLLTNPFEPFRPPSAESRTEFDSYTAAINVTDRGPDGPYNLQQIKDDAIWLSNEARIAETVALRLVVLEWQSRARVLLLAVGATETGSHSKRDTFTDSFRASSFFASSPHLNASFTEERTEAGALDTEPNRRNRLLCLYLSERLHLLRTADLLIRNHVEAVKYFSVNPQSSQVATLAEHVITAVCCTSSGNLSPDTRLLDLNGALQQRLNRLQSGSGWYAADGGNSDMELAWLQAQVDELVSILQLYHCLLSRVNVSGETAIPYLDMMIRTDFLDLQVPVQNKDLRDLTKLLASLVAAKFFFRGPEAPSSTGQTRSFNHESMDHINRLMTNATTSTNTLASIPIYFWVVFLLRYSDEQPESHTDQLTGPTYLEDDNLKNLANTAVDNMQFFDGILQAMALLRKWYKGSHDLGLETDLRMSFLFILLFSMERHLVVYGEPVVWALLSILDSDRSYWEPTENRILDTFSPAELGEDMLQYWISYARDRFPLETHTFLKIMKALLGIGVLGSEGWLQFSPCLYQSSVFTERLNLGFDQYEEAESELVEDLSSEDISESAAYLIRLRGILPIFVPNWSAPVRSNSGPSHALVLADNNTWQADAGVEEHTIGEVINDQTPSKIVSWHYSFSPLSFLVDWLATATSACRFVLYSTLRSPSPDEVCAALDLLATALQALKDTNETTVDANTVAQELLEKTPEYFEYDKDLIAIVFDLFEDALLQHRDKPGHEIPVEHLSRCVEFFHAASYFTPGRILTLLARSQLLDLNGTDPSLVTIVSNFEMIRGDYSFLLSCVKLFERLIDIAYLQDSPRPMPFSRNGLTLFSNESGGIKQARFVPNKTVHFMMTSFLRMLVSVFENSQFWPFTFRDQRALVNSSLMSSFEKILRATLGFDEEQDLEKKATNVLAESAVILVELLLSDSSQSNLSSPLISILSSSLLDSTNSPEFAVNDDLLEKKSALSLATALLRVATATKHADSLLEQRLFRIAPLLARMYAFSPSMQASTAELMDVLLSASLRHNTSPPSLLGHMGAKVAKAFLMMLSRTTGQIRTEKHQLATWSLVSTVVSAQQQWFALYILTGKAPRGGISGNANNGQETGCAGQPVFKYALDQLSGTFASAPEKLNVPLAMLQFVSRSYNHWPWAVTALQEHPRFITSMTSYFGNLTRDGVPVARSTWESVFAASICEILAMYVHTARQTGDAGPALRLVNRLRYIKNFAFKLPDYNHSIHSLLRQNVASVCPGLAVTSFQHTLVFPVEYGENFFYDVPLATSMIRAKRVSARSGRALDFGVDFKSANLDLSKVDSQLQLNRKARLLAVELAQALSRDTNSELVDPLLDFIHDCLENLRTSMLPSSLIAQLENGQIDLVLAVLRQLVSVRAPTKQRDLVDLFPTLWQSICSLIPAFDDMYLDRHADLNRRLLQILFLGLQPLVRWTGAEPDLAASVRATVINRLPSSTYTQLLEVVSEVVCRGFKSLSNLVHENQNATSPSDFALLTAILQSILAVPGIETMHSQISLQFQSSEVARYAASLFSWSDKLVIDGDPVYGEHSILFLLELSSVASMAESMAVSGILTQLSSANIMALYSRPSGVGPFDNPARGHSIWARGILPLCLNLFSAVGGPVAAEVASFLGQFGPQMSRLVRTLANANSPIGTRPGDSHMTLNIAAEAHSLSLISTIMDAIRAAGAASTNGSSTDVVAMPSEWDKQGVKEDIDDWLKARTQRRDWILPATDRDVELANKQPEDAGSRCLNRLEEKVWNELIGAHNCLDGRLGT